jgi:colicin import membrane protein
MARDKTEQSTTEAKPERTEPIKPMPFPGESPTVALAMAAGQMYGLHEEDEKPAKSAPKKRATAKKKAARPTKKATTPKKKAAAPKKKAASKSRKTAKRTSASPSKGTRKGK